MAESLRTQIREQLLDEIRSGRIAPGERLPSERTLAERYGVSRVTVREALQGLAVEGIVERNPGRGTRVVASARSDAAKVIALVIPDLRSEFYGAVAEAFIRAAAGSLFEVAVRVHGDDQATFDDAIRSLADRGVAGLGAVIPRTCRESGIRILERLDLPRTLLLRGIPHLAVNQVVIDNVRVGEIATSHLIRLGHKRIAHLALLDYSVGKDRLAGYRRALSAAGIPYDPDLVVNLAAYPIVSSAGRPAVEELLETGVPFSAIVAFNDHQAAMALSALMGRGIRVPEDVAVIGIDDSPGVSALYPGLSTVRIDWEEIGRKGAQLLLSEVRSPGEANPAISFAGASVLPRRTCGQLSVEA